MFGMDPVALLEEPSMVRRAIRDAAWQVNDADMRAFLGGGD